MLVDELRLLVLMANKENKSRMDMTQYKDLIYRLECFLESNILQLKFKKLDGSMRHMMCTRNVSMIYSVDDRLDYDSIHSTLSSSDFSASYDVVDVYDVEKNDYRRFNIQRLLFESVRVEREL